MTEWAIMHSPWIVLAAVLLYLVIDVYRKERK